MDMFNAENTPSEKNLYNIPGPPENRTLIPLLSPLAHHSVPPVFGSNTHRDPDNSLLSTLKKNSKCPRHKHCPQKLGQ